MPGFWAYWGSTRKTGASAIHDLIRQIDDWRLRERLQREWAAAARDKKFELVFEEHLPELLPLYGVKPRQGDRVCKKRNALAPARIH